SSLCYTVILKSYLDHLDLHSFPTRRSSDLNSASDGIVYSSPDAGTSTARAPGLRLASQPSGTATTTPITTGTSDSIRCSPSSSRSEEHTSELQSRENIVCRLLLEKKNNKYN